MIYPPSGWTSRRHPRGLTLWPPEGPSLATLEYVEREFPLRPPDQLLACLLAAESDLSADSIGVPEILVTAEGEYGAVVGMGARRALEAVRLDVGFVFGDDFYSRVVSIARVEDDRFARTVRELVIADAQQLGVRRRRFLHTRPAGWHGEPYGLETRWLCPDAPRTHAAITVWPATPVPVASADVIANLVAGSIDEPSDPVPVASDHGLYGHLWQRVGRFSGSNLVARDLAILQDDRFHYAARLDTACDAARRATLRTLFFELIRSFQPIPKAARSGDVSPSPFPVD